MTMVLEFRDVVRAYERGKNVLDGVSFSIRPEETVALLGRNGAGKTTLIHLAMGMLFPQRGSVRAFGLVPTEQPVAVKRRIGYVAEDQVLPPTATIAELLSFHRRLFPAWDSVFERQLLERFGLAGHRGRIATLSRGQARQLALVLAVAHRPELLVLDEPAGGLDPAARREFLETSVQLLNREGTAILFSSHHMADVERLGGRVVLLDGGRVLVDTDLDALREAHTVAVLPSTVSTTSLEALPGNLRVRRASDGVHAVFSGTPQAVSSMLAERIGGRPVSCAVVPLEELFVELVGGRSEQAAA